MTRSAPPGARPPDAPPERLGRYRLVRPISTGGMARVFEGRRESLAGVSPRVAVKVILPDFATDEGFQRLFVNEARIGSQLQHQNLVQIQDFDRQGEHFYLVMEFVDGVTLRRAIGLCRRHGMLIPMPVIAELGRQVCDGLHYAHTACGEDGNALHLIHRDIKPSNLMINAQGVVKVLDFGISRALFSHERQGTVKGTWGYMAPEQAMGREIGPTTDVFGLASVMYELATLRPLFPEREPKDLRAALAADEGAKRAIGLSGPAGVLAPVLVRALQRDPHARFPSALAFQRSLGGLLANPVTAREQLVHFWATLMELQGESPSGGAYRSAASLLDQSSRGSGHVSSASAASGSYSASLASSASPSVPEPASGQGLAVAVGRPPPDLDLGEPIAPAEPGPEPRRRSRGLLGVLATLLAVAVLIFAGSKVLEGRRPGPVAPASSPGTAEFSLGSVLGSLEDDPQPGVSAATEAQVKEPAAAPSPQVRSPAPPPPTPAPVESAPPRGEPSSPDPTPAPQPEPVVESSADPVPSSPGSEGDAAAQGLLTVSSLPRAQVIVDGQFVGWAPMLQHPVSAGNHTVTLVSEDGRRYTFRVALDKGEEVRRVWHFDRSTWVEQ
jgi:eukaryotic-like serine/threonine-protein kinase